MEPQTMQYLDGRGYVAEGRVRRSAIVGDLLKAVDARPCENLTQVEETTLIVPEWRAEVLGEPDDPVVRLELNALVGQLMTIRKGGPLQSALRRNGDGMVLCKPYVMRDDDDGVPRRKPGRVASADADVIRTHALAGEFASAVKSMSSARELEVEATDRVPALEQYRPNLLGATRQQIEQLLLESPEEAFGSDDDDDGEQS